MSAVICERLASIEQQLQGVPNSAVLREELAGVQASIAGLPPQVAEQFVPLVDQLAVAVANLPQSATCKACGKTVTIDPNDLDAILVAGYWEDSDGSQYCGDCPADEEPATCQFSGCRAPATLHMVLRHHDGYAYLDRDICGEHAGLEARFLSDVASSLTITKAATRE